MPISTNRAPTAPRSRPGLGQGKYGGDIRAPRDRRGPARAGERQRRAGGRPARSSARALAERRRDRPALRLSHYQLDGGQLDRRRGADRVRPAGDEAHDRGAGRRAELSRVARREPLRVSRGHHRPTPGSPDVLVLRHDLPVHPVGQLVRPDPGRRVDRVGTPDPRGLPARAAAVSRCERGREPDAGDGARVLRHVDRVGDPGGRRRRLLQGAVRAEGETPARCVSSLSSCSSRRAASR